MANNPITPTKVNFATGDVLTAQQVNDLASALNRDVAFATQATANSTKTLVVTDAKTQEFTGTVAGQIVVMPVTSTLGVGMAWLISNKSTQSIAVNSSGGNLIFTVPAATNWLFTCALITGTTASSWSNSYAWASAVPAAVSSSPSLYVKNITGGSNYSTSSTTRVALDTTNARITATPVGTVAQVILSAMIVNSGTADGTFGCISSQGTSYDYKVQWNAYGGLPNANAVAVIVITGMTAGVSTTFDWAWFTSASTLTMYADASAADYPRMTVIC